MTREQIGQYRALKREIKQLEESIEKLQKQADELPTVAGKVQASQKEWPYIEEHVTVEMSDPKQEDTIMRRIIIRERRLADAQKAALEIEQFIAGIKDSTDRQILELAYLDGKTQEEIADIVNLERSTVSKRISNLLDE